jgi:hypothetical protein
MRVLLSHSQKRVRSLQMGKNCRLGHRHSQVCAA